MTDLKLQKVSADAACFVCGDQNPVGLKADFITDKETRSSHAELRLVADFQGWQDVIHGGVLAALLDEACIYACRSLADQCVTAEIQVRYRKPVPVGSHVEVTGQLIDSHRKIWQAKAQLKVAGVLHAEAQAKVYVLNQ